MFRAIRAAVLTVTVGVSLTLVATTPAQVAAAAKPPKPVITKVSPKTGPTAGGTVVTIKGKNLKTATKVLFGSAKGLKLTVKSDRKLKVTAPPHAAGTVDVKVKTKGGKSGKASAARFTFVAPPTPPPPPPPPPPPATLPTVTGVSPTAGTTSGGTSVTVTGTSLTGATSVTFDGIPGTGLTPVSATSLTVVTPAHALGPVDVRVTTAAGTSAVGPQFTYVDGSGAPVVEAVDPPSGPVTGGVTVTVTGTGFATGTVVRFGTTLGTDLEIIDGQQLRVTSPPHDAGTVSILVTTPGGQSADVPEDDFEYLNADPRAYPAPLPGDADEDGQGAFLNAVDCPAVQVCFAVGGYLAGGQRVPLAEQRVDADSWQPFRPDLPEDAAAGADSSLQDVDCVSPTYCVAVGTYADESFSSLPYAETWDGETWTPGTSPSFPADADFSVFDEQLLSDVECTAVGSCVAVGRYHESINGDSVPLLLELSGGSWQSADLDLDGGTTGELTAVDCPAASSCVAVGQDTTAEDLPLAVTGPGTWTAALLPLPANVDPTPNASLVDVSCSSAGACVAAGSYRDATLAMVRVQGLVQQLNGTTWTPSRAVAPLPPNGANQPNVAISDVSCASTCAVVGDYTASAGTGGGRRPLLVRFVGGAPVAERGAVPDESGGQLNSGSTTVLCATGSRCLSAGYYDDGSGVWTPLLESLASNAWMPSDGPAPGDNGGVLRPEASDLDGTVGVAVGLYNDAGGNQLALLMLDLPFPPT